MGELANAIQTAAPIMQMYPNSADFIEADELFKTVERYGQGGDFHVSPENMEMAFEQDEKIVAYVGENFTADKGEYIALVLKKAE